MDSDDATPELLTCCPEWCEKPNDGHDPTCPEHPMTLTKAEFVAAASQGARMAVETYRMLLEDDTEWSDWSESDKLDMVVAEAEEGSICFAGIGSCGRGWCKH